jgi:hypothetical protein
LKARFIKNFHGTCKQPMTIVDLDHCVQREDESAHHWVRRVSAIIILLITSRRLRQF